MHAYDVENFNEVYAKAIRDVMLVGADVPSRNGDTKELHPVMILVDNPLQHLVTATGRPVNVAFALAEVIWILKGGRDVELPGYYNSKISDYSDNGETFNAAYGHRMRHAFGFDQIEDVIRTLQADPGTRQAVLNIWHPENDRGFIPGPQMPDQDHVEQYIPNITADRACNMLAHLMIRDGKLDWLQILRSNDAMWGTPYNWMQWSHVQEYIASRVGVPVGKYIHVADSFHVYHYHYEEARSIRSFNLYEVLGRSHMPMDALAFPQVAELEHRLRNSPLSAPFEPHLDAAEVGAYWEGVLGVLDAHRFYRAGDNNEALDRLLACPDMIYSTAQIRFYVSKRWYKLPDMMERVNKAVDNERIMAWISAS